MTESFNALNKKLGGGEKPTDWHQHANGGGWVHKSASVDESAYVSEAAIVWGEVFGDARVFGNAQVFGDAWEKSPLFIIGSTYSLTNAKHGYIQIGCECHPFEWWLKNGKALAVKNGFTKEQIAEYAAYVKLFIKVGK